MFLQAAGMSHSQVRAIADRLDFDSLTENQRVLAELAWKTSIAPVSFSYKDTLPSRALLRSEGEFLEAALVTAGFSFANRCADALGVRTEVPSLLHRWPDLRWKVMGLLSWAIRKRTDLANRKVKDVSPDECIDDLRAAMERADMGELPPFFEKLRPRPDLLAVQATATRAALLENRLDRRTNLSVARVVAATNHDNWWIASTGCQLSSIGVSLAPLDAIARLGPAAGEDDRLSTLEREILLFARDVSLCPDRTTNRQVTQLRTLGMTDELILDLVALSAAVAAGNRLNRMLVPEDKPATDAAAKPGYALQ
jgi:alkylhydroperoxidase family enzyme